MTVRVSVGAILVALLLVAIGAGGAVGVMLWEPWDGEDHQRRLTGAEAAAIVLDRENERLSADSPASTLVYLSCEADDFNERLKA